MRLLGGTAAIALVVLAAPVTVIALAAAGAGWLRGWPPARLYRAAAWSLPMTLIYLVAVALQSHRWQALVLSPVTSWQDASALLVRARIAQAVLLIVPWAVPAGLAAGGTAWAWRT